MPLPQDPHVVETGKEIIGVLKGIFGPHPGFRPAHAKGLLVKGTFTPTPVAAGLSKAPHFNNPSTPIVARFSSSTGIPQLPDSDANGNPRGFALRFVLAETPIRKHTDIVAHSVPFFPAATPDETLAFFQAVAAAGTNPDVLGAHIAAHPAAQAFVAAPKPTPSSFSREAFYGVNAFKFVNAEGKETFVRYRILPVEGLDTLDEATAAAQEPNFLFDGVKERLGASKSIQYRLVVQVANDGDVTDDNTVHWPEEGPDARELVELGLVSLDTLEPDSATDAAQQKYLIFDPVPRVDGIEPSADPLIDVRAAIYLISGRERRAA